MTIQHLVVDVAVAESLVGDNAGGVLALASVEGRKLDLPFRGQGELEPCFLNPVQLPLDFINMVLNNTSSQRGRRNRRSRTKLAGGWP
jgi:hypothetical protein